MRVPPALDPDLLRAFVLIAEGSSFTHAASLVGRTQSAVSMQVKRLEEVLGQPVLQRGKGGGIDLTPHGQYLLTRARQILALNDEVVGTFRTPDIAGRVRLGTPDDYAFRFLPAILMRFAETHPAVEVEVICAPSSELVERLKVDELDLTLLSEGHEPRGWEARELWRGSLVWITSTRHAPYRQSPVPLAVAHAQCSWRLAALGAMEKAGVPYRVAYTSATQAGTHAPAIAGLAVTVSTMSWLPEGLRALRPEEGLPSLPEFSILLLMGKRAPGPVPDALAAHIEASFSLEASRQKRQPNAA